MTKNLLCVLFMVGCFTIGASCQDSSINNSKAEAIIKSTFDSLEMVQRPENIGLVPQSENKVYTITICSQKKFDKILPKIDAALQSGERNILVKIKKGTYFFSEGHLSFAGKHYPDADIKIKGKGVTIVPKGWKLKENDEIPCEVSGESCFVDLKRKESISLWGEMMYADDLIEIIDEKEKLCRLKCEALGELRVQQGSRVFIDLTRWCRCYQYKVLKIENGYVDFYAHDLEKDNVFGTKHYSVNYDYVVGRTNPRFRLCNATGKERVCVIDGRVKLCDSLKSVYLGDASSFISLQSSEFRQFVVEGITFLGNKQSSDALIKLSYFRTYNIEFTGCRFIGQMGEIISTDYSDNLYFHDNYVADNYAWGINVNSSSSNITIENNTFENNGIGLSYARCVSCSGNNYYIAHNTFKNFGYCAISIGAWYGVGKRVPSKGIVEYNEMWYDNAYFCEAWKHTIMDSGAIYLWTQNDGAIIRYNYIHDYTGMSQNHGIYCDDGAHHMAIYGNVILNTPMGHTIGSRRVARTEKARNKSSYSVRNNIKNFIAYNIVDGTIQFVGYEDKPNGCLKGTNVRMMHDGQLLFSHNLGNEYKGLEVEEMDTEYEYVSHNENSIVLKENGNKVLRGLPVFDKIDKLVKLK